MEQLSLMDLLEALENDTKFEGDLEKILTDEDIPYLRENLLIESVKSAFGESRGGQKRKPSDDAWEWIISEDRELPFSFNQCCLACGVDPDKMLDWLRYYKRKFMS
ncbi:MAG: hypothetical protein CBE36_07275 [Oceanospirillaceae bacterium TMED276]|jgi:hypothetical protein|nr:MAG: hypothetical protein CBE36_07275 [Oceanospirillaceae bacterium TMED276]|tara:strand:+ start:199 stop:516 length:318 start_codon:yes stop_codon:yes gene_type:complete